MISVLLPSHKREIPRRLAVGEAAANHPLEFSKAVVSPVVHVLISSLGLFDAVKAKAVKVFPHICRGVSNNLGVAFLTIYASIIMSLVREPFKTVQDCCHCGIMYDSLQRPNFEIVQSFLIPKQRLFFTGAASLEQALVGFE